MEVCESLGQPVDEPSNVFEEIRTRFGEVPNDTAESEIVEHESLAGQIFEDVLDALALLDRVHKRRREIPTDIERVRSDGEHMREDAAEFGGHRPDHLRVFRYLNIGQILGRSRVGPLVEQPRRDVVPAVGVRHDLVAIRAVLAHLLLTAVEVADVGFEVDHLLAVENGLDVEHAVGRRVVRADVEEHRLAVALGFLIL